MAIRQQCPEAGVLNASFSADEYVLREFSFQHQQENQLLFFFKPECFLSEVCSRPRAVLDLAMSKFRDYGVGVTGSLYLSGRRLQQLGVMDRHYGYITRMSKTASTLLTAVQKEEILRSLEVRQQAAVPLLGGHECLRRFPDLSEEVLNDLWLEKKSVKIRSGLYCQKYRLNGQDVVIVNGFLPKQLLHYTAASHAIIVLLLQTDCDWEVLRANLIGDTFPEKALAGSIRGELFRNKEVYGISQVSISNNFTHLSAGPFEAMFEIYNFLKDVESTRFALDLTRMAQLMMSAGLPAADVQRCLENPSVEVQGEQVDLFSLTENLNSREAVARFQEFR